MSRVFRGIVRVKTARTIGNTLNVRALSTCSPNNSEFDIVVVGGGIVGAATARELKQRFPDYKMALLEKERKLAMHQSGHNSGVIHAGIYYVPGSLKAQLCVEGLKLAYQYCNEKNIPYKKVGKLIVATTPDEVKRLHVLYERGRKNQVEGMELLDGEGCIRKKAPACKGLQAIWSPSTGIVDWAVVTNSYGEDFKKAGGEIFLNFEVCAFQDSKDNNFPVQLKTKSGKSVKAKYVLTCGGLQSDKLAQMSGCPRSPRIVPFRGEYLLLNPSKAHLVPTNIYPVPDPRFPFLGVHFTPRMDGSIWLGPNAVLAFKREGYKWSDIHIGELLDSVLYPGFIKMAFKYMRAGMIEMVKSIYTPLQVKDLQKYISCITPKDCTHGPAGVRAQALDSSGNLLEDFYFDMKKGKGASPVAERVLHCRNAPSPGATSSLAIGKMIADKIQKEFNLG